MQSKGEVKITTFTETVKVNGNRPIVCFAVFGTYNLTALSAIPPQ